MIGIESIGVFIPETRVDNKPRSSHFEFDDSFLDDKLGVLKTSKAPDDEGSFDMAKSAIENLVDRCGIEISDVEVLIVVTQTPGSPIPHISARLHGAFEIQSSCACFDVSLGCSGYVYGLEIAKSLMETNGFESGILVTSDPYSKIVDPEDKNTAMLFGDAATATLLTDNSRFKIGKTTLNTNGMSGDHLKTLPSGKLTMNGRAVFNFCAQAIPPDIRKNVDANDLDFEEIDLFLIHQGSKFIVDTIRTRLKLSEEKMPFGAGEYGNTVSSSIPLLLAEHLDSTELNRIVISGFGVGLSWATTTLTRINS